MQSSDSIRRYREMSADERLRLTLLAIRESAPFLHYGEPELVRRKLQHLRQRKRESNRQLGEGLARAALHEAS